jgi:hypothetical protein
MSTSRHSAVFVALHATFRLVNAFWQNKSFHNYADYAMGAFTKAGNLSVFGKPKEIKPSTGGQIAILTESGSVHELDAIYPALGCDVRSELASVLGPRARRLVISSLTTISEQAREAFTQRAMSSAICIT